MEDITNLDELLNFNDDDITYDNKDNDNDIEDDNDDDDDDDGDSDFLELQEKLTGQCQKIITSNQPMESLSPEQLIEKLQKENLQLQQQVEEWKLATDIVDPNTPSTDDLLEQISELEAQLRRTDISHMLQKIQGLETTNRRLLDENSQLQQHIHQLEQQSQRMLEEHIGDGPVTSSKSLLDVPKVSLSSTSSSSSSSWQHASPMAKIHELESIVQNLQDRIMGLVEEKLALKLDLDQMEHQIKHYQKMHPNTPGNLFASTRRTWFLSPGNKHDETATEIEDKELIEDSTNTTATQTDYLKEAMERKKKRETTFGFGLGFGVANTSSSNYSKEFKDGLLDKDVDVHPTLHQKEPELSVPDDPEGHLTNANHNHSDREGTPLEVKSALATGKLSFSSLFGTNKPEIKEEDGQFASAPSSRQHDRSLPPLLMDHLTSVLDNDMNKQEIVDETIDFGEKPEVEEKSELFPLFTAKKKMTNSTITSAPNSPNLSNPENANDDDNKSEKE